MPRRGAFALVMTALAVVLLLNFRTPTEISAVTGAVARPGVTGTSQGAGGTTGASGRTGTAGSGAGAGSSAGQASTVTGPVVDTRFGPVQVEVTVSGGALSDVTALQLPDGDRRSASISSRAEPTLRSQALQAQSARIDGVSGATYTSIAYARSLQAALDQAGL